MAAIISNLPPLTKMPSPSPAEQLQKAINAIRLGDMSTLTVLKMLLQSQENVPAFMEMQGLSVLAAALKTNNTQTQYNTAFCLWLLSDQYADDFHKEGILRKLAKIVKSSSTEKVVRLSFAIFRNLLSQNHNIITEDMIGLGLLTVAETLIKRKFKDQDLVVDLEYVQKVLRESIEKFSTFEVYQSELTSGNLQFSPVHLNETFWHDNIAQFEKEDWTLVKRLIQLLADADPLVREVAAFDLGEFARFHPDGKSMVNKLGGKAKLMLLLKDPEIKVQRQALLAIQKLMVAHWEMLTKSSQQGVASLVSQKK